MQKVITLIKDDIQKKVIAEIVSEWPAKLPEVSDPLLVDIKSHKSCLIEFSNTEKAFQVLTLENNRIDSVCVLIGHSEQVFRQHFYGQRFLVMPFKKKDSKFDTYYKYSINKFK